MSILFRLKLNPVTSLDMQLESEVIERMKDSGTSDPHKDKRRADRVKDEIMKRLAVYVSIDGSLTVEFDYDPNRSELGGGRVVPLTDPSIPPGSFVG